MTSQKKKILLLRHVMSWKPHLTKIIVTTVHEHQLLRYLALCRLYFKWFEKILIIYNIKDEIHEILLLINKTNFKGYIRTFCF